MNGEIDYERIRVRVEQRLKKRRKFVSQLVEYATAMAILWAIWFLTGRGWPWPLIPSGIIAIVAVREFLEKFVFAPAMESAYDREMAREIARERARLGISDSNDTNVEYEKPKRGEKTKNDEPRLRLSDDGELVPVDEAEETDSQRSAGYGSRNSL